MAGTMKLNLEIEPGQYYNGVHELVRLAYQGWLVQPNSPEGADMRLGISVERQGSRAVFRAVAEDASGLRILDESVFSMGLPSAGKKYGGEGSESRWDNELRKALRVFVYNMLCRQAGRNISQYGLLTGMRPVKAAHRLLDILDDAGTLEGALKREYMVDEEKSALLAEIARTSRPFLPEPQAPQRLPVRDRPVSLYIGVPYCPSRCDYCSFPGAVLRNYQQEIPPFLTCLFREMEALGGCLEHYGARVDTVYIGGGTPTILDEKDLEALFTNLWRCFPGAGTGETSMEAGRADTLTAAKLRLMREAGVNRLCINPQTMQDRTLAAIGRRHTAQQVEDMVNEARRAGFNTLNMDLIAGLPGEGQADCEYNCSRLLDLQPENITVHSLAVKRGSPMATRIMQEQGFPGLNEPEMNEPDWSGSGPGQTGGGPVEKAVRYCETAFRAAGYRPYYLYRQKYIRDNMENIGYALSGHICRYNVLMIEERQTIIGLGGGAASKFVDAGQELAGVFYNPKDPYFYRRDIERLAGAKVDKLGALF